MQCLLACFRPAETLRAANRADLDAGDALVQLPANAGSAAEALRDARVLRPWRMQRAQVHASSMPGWRTQHASQGKPATAQEQEQYLQVLSAALAASGSATTALTAWLGSSAAAKMQQPPLELVVAAHCGPAGVERSIHLLKLTVWADTGAPGTLKTNEHRVLMSVGHVPVPMPTADPASSSGVQQLASGTVNARDSALVMHRGCAGQADTQPAAAPAGAKPDSMHQPNASLLPCGLLPSVLDSVPQIITVIDVPMAPGASGCAAGCVIYQNAPSSAYAQMAMGLRGYLIALTDLEEEKASIMQAIAEAVQTGQIWSGVCRVPALLNLTDLPSASGAASGSSRMGSHQPSHSSSGPELRITTPDQYVASSLGTHASGVRTTGGHGRETYSSIAVGSQASQGPWDGHYMFVEGAGSTCMARRSVDMPGRRTSTEAHSWRNSSCPESTSLTALPTPPGSGRHSHRSTRNTGGAPMLFVPSTSNGLLRRSPSKSTAQLCAALLDPAHSSGDEGPGSGDEVVAVAEPAGLPLPRRPASNPHVPLHNGGGSGTFNPHVPLHNGGGSGGPMHFAAHLQDDLSVPRSGSPRQGISISPHSAYSRTSGMLSPSLPPPALLNSHHSNYLMSGDSSNGVARSGTTVQDVSASYLSSSRAGRSFAGIATGGGASSPATRLQSLLETQQREELSAVMAAAAASDGSRKHKGPKHMASRGPGMGPRSKPGATTAENALRNRPGSCTVADEDTHDASEQDVETQGGVHKLVSRSKSFHATRACAAASTNAMDANSTNSHAKHMGAHIGSHPTVSWARCDEGPQDLHGGPMLTWPSKKSSPGQALQPLMHQNPGMQKGLQEAFGSTADPCLSGAHAAPQGSGLSILTTTESLPMSGLGNQEWEAHEVSPAAAGQQHQLLVLQAQASQPLSLSPRITNRTDSSIEQRGSEHITELSLAPMSTYANAIQSGLGASSALSGSQMVDSYVAYLQHCSSNSGVREDMLIPPSMNNMAEPTSGHSVTLGNVLIAARGSESRDLGPFSASLFTSSQPSRLPVLPHLGQADKAPGIRELEEPNQDQGGEAGGQGKSEQQEQVPEASESACQPMSADQAVASGQGDAEEGVAAEAQAGLASDAEAWPAASGLPTDVAGAAGAVAAEVEVEQGQGQEQEDEGQANVSTSSSGLASSGEQVVPVVTEYSWHEVTVVPIQDKHTSKQFVLVAQQDVTDRYELERRLMALTTAQLQLLEHIFPKHILDELARMSARQAQLPRTKTHREADLEPAGRLTPSTQPNSTAGAGPQPGPPKMPQFGMAELTKMAMHHENVTILFADCVGFTSMSKASPPHDVMMFLNQLFSRFDQRLSAHNHLWKVETAGDAYLVAGGLMGEDDKGFKVVQASGGGRLCHAYAALSVFRFALDMLRLAKEVQLPHTGEPAAIRIGIHSGPVVSGLVGLQLPKYSLFGDTMNHSARLEGSSKPGCIHISSITQELLSILPPGELPEGLKWEPTGGIFLKGLGVCPTFLYQPPGEPAAPTPEAATPPPGIVTAQVSNQASPIPASATTADESHAEAALEQATAEAIPVTGEPRGSKAGAVTEAKLEALQAMAAAVLSHACPQTFPDIHGVVCSQDTAASSMADMAAVCIPSIDIDQEEQIRREVARLRVGVYSRGLSRADSMANAGDSGDVLADLTSPNAHQRHPQTDSHRMRIMRCHSTLSLGSSMRYQPSGPLQTLYESHDQDKSGAVMQTMSLASLRPSETQLVVGSPKLHAHAGDAPGGRAQHGGVTAPHLHNSVSSNNMAGGSRRMRAADGAGSLFHAMPMGGIDSLLAMRKESSLADRFNLQGSGGQGSSKGVCSEGNQYLSAILAGIWANPAPLPTKGSSRSQLSERISLKGSQ